MKVSLTGPVQLELIAPYFAKAGYGVAAPGEIPDITYDVTSHEKILAEETPGFYDPRMEKLAGCPYSLAGIEAIVDEFRWQVAGMSEEVRVKSEELRRERFYKVLAVDADNTLWHGILSEDGPDALVPCEEFQKGLKSLADDGVVLVLLSKNDPGSIEQLAHHNSSLFTLTSSLAASRVNWEPKAGNLIEICRELNLGLDSVVFVDDNPHERAQMKAHLPEVTVAPWNGWGERGSEEIRVKSEEVLRERQLVRRLREYFFADVGKTAEDKLRAADYRRRLNDAALSPRMDKNDYLRSLDLWVEARLAEARDLDRLAQMAGKTNQFNATTIRRPRSDFENLVVVGSGSGTAEVFIFRAGDKFGEQGIVCYVIIDREGRRITDFVMSCRAMGRTLEHFAYEWVAERVGFRPAIDFIPTAKNAPAKEFVEKVAKGGRLETYFKEIGNGKEG